MTQDEIYQMIVDVLHDTFELDPAKITRDANLYTDLDIDSIDAVDLAVKLKQLTGKRLTAESFKTVRTVQDVINAIEALTKE
ncbi:acyl carrier protein [Chitinivorax sp. B]|uniref:acyl carrier protein n=1 Tax=Chitinivorax sp. B TaxID=2502235 RepID=UPI0010F82803|nr:acyl carrier protein [Chitinivorax sp. B]